MEVMVQILIQVMPAMVAEVALPVEPAAILTMIDPGESIGLGASGTGDIAAFTGINTSTTVQNIGALDVTPEFIADGKTCYGVTNSDCDLIVKPLPSSALTASQQDVCPNTTVTLNPNCSIPAATALWNPGAPTVTPNAPDITYTYKVACEVDGCFGGESEVKVNTWRLLVDIISTGSSSPAPINGMIQADLGKDLTIAKNTITNTDAVRKWNIIAKPCDAPVGSMSFEFLGGPLPLTFKTVDNYAPHAFFANLDATN